MRSRLNVYQGQIVTVLQCIHALIMKNWTDEKAEAFNHAVSIRSLAQTAGMSVRNLQLMFKAYTGETVRQYIIRLRTEYARLMLKEGQQNQREISEYLGFANPSALNNVFQKHLHCTPEQTKARLLEKDTPDLFPVLPCRVERIDGFPVLVTSFIQDYEKCNRADFEAESWDKLYEYARQKDLLPEKEDYWGIAYDDTDITPADKCRFYACMAISKRSGYKASLTDTFKRMDIPGGMYAVYTHRGDYALLNAFYNSILKHLPFPYYIGETAILEHYLHSPAATPAIDWITEVWVPIVK